MKLKIDAELDLHGMDASEALEAIEGFMNHSHLTNRKRVLIIHGNGETLAEIVLDYLDECSFILGYSAAPNNLGGVGATVVEL